MKDDTTHSTIAQPEAETAVYLFDDWFDPIEAGVQDRVGGFIQAMIKDELDEYRGYGARWLGRVQQLYKEKQTLAMARARGYILKGREVIETSQGKQVRLQFAVRR